MSFLNDFDSEKKYTATFEKYTNTYTNNVITGKTWSTVGTASCLLWNTAMAKIQVSEKYKQEIEALAVFNYEDITFTIEDSGRVIINGKVYAIILSENVAEQNEIIQVMLKKYES